MPSDAIYKKLTTGGGFSLPFLLHLYANETTNIFLINDNQDYEYNGNLYKASAFNYSPTKDGDATLEVELVDNDIIALFENNYNFKADIIGVVLEDGTVQQLSVFKHTYGTATWDGAKAQISFSSDDRLNMSFPALIFSSYNNRGNASV